MNKTILSQVLKEGIGWSETTSLQQATRECLEQQGFKVMVQCALDNLAIHPSVPKLALAPALAHAIQIGIAYAKAEREVADLEAIT